MSSVRTLDPKLISVGPNRLRKVNEKTVNEIAESMKEIGQISPIEVIHMGVGFRLVSGWHRLEAAKRAKLEGIMAVVLDSDMNDDEVSLHEIDENLMRGDLGHAERCLFTDLRKEIYERRHPEAKHGAVGRGGKEKKSGQNGHSSEPADRFTKEVSDKTGKPERTVRRDAARGKALKGILPTIVGTSLDKGDELDAMAKLPPEKQKELAEAAAAGEKVSAKIEIKKVARAEKEQTLATKQHALPDKRYGVIVADPEWKFETYSENGMDRSADNHYPTSALDVIKSRDVASISAPDCALFLWATAPMLPQALEVMKAWGFEYKSNMVWDKIKTGTGYWFRNRHEHLLVGTKGNIPAPAPGTQWASLLDKHATAHSEKPEEALEMVEAYFPNLPKIELNRRGLARPGWDAWGNELESVMEAAE